MSTNLLPTDCRKAIKSAVASAYKAGDVTEDERDGGKYSVVFFGENPKENQIVSHSLLDKVDMSGKGPEFQRDMDSRAKEAKVVDFVMTADESMWDEYRENPDGYRDHGFSQGDRCLAQSGAEQFRMHIYRMEDGTVETLADVTADSLCEYTVERIHRADPDFL